MIKPLEFDGTTHHQKAVALGTVFEVLNDPVGDRDWWWRHWKNGVWEKPDYSHATTHEEAIAACNAKWKELLSPFFTDESSQIQRLVDVVNGEILANQIIAVAVKAKVISEDVADQLSYDNNVAWKTQRKYV
ncbi:MAG: hypothetical protein VW739_05515 [Pelagibacteraceae bacterium]